MTTSARFGFTEQRVGLYELEADTAESWMANYDRTALWFDVVEMITEGVRLFSAIERRARSMSDSAIDSARLEALYRKWLGASKNVLRIYEELKQKVQATDSDFANSKLLLSRCQECEEVLGSIEIARLTPSMSEFRAFADRSPPPASWYEEPNDI